MHWPRARSLLDGSPQSHCPSCGALNHSFGAGAQIAPGDTPLYRTSFEGLARTDPPGTRSACPAASVPGNSSVGVRLPFPSLTPYPGTNSTRGALTHGVETAAALALCQDSACRGQGQDSAQTARLPIRDIPELTLQQVVRCFLCAASRSVDPPEQIRPDARRTCQLDKLGARGKSCRTAPMPALAA